ncbi:MULTISPECIES: Hsp33 family molecular chaperone HslO [Methylotenera]|uniref:Hsp33 family molecular chaperone HslO n=1 Tax=Methylotenera TaxID=359407 RepID=UPI00036503D1|nr:MULTISPECIES: Hsp33 family molecular chaperone HslO [Methylotenera]
MKNSIENFTENLTDTLHHFIFEDSLHQPMPIRGNLVRLNTTYTQVLQHQTLPSVLKHALGELMAASALLSATLKMDGALVLQIQSKGALKLLVVECSSDLNMRATAKWDETQTNKIAEKPFFDLVKNGQFIITLDPKEGEAYQGIVPIEGETVAEMLQNYMLRSQQIDTSLWLHADETSASGLLLQKLPDFGGNLGGVSSSNVSTPLLDDDAWNRMNVLANTITNEELKDLPAETLLTRLFAEENVRLFEPKSTQFHCSCNQSSVASMLRMLGEDELNSILAEFGKIEVNCDFCNKHYLFDAVDTAQLLATEAAVSISKAKH